MEQPAVNPGWRTSSYSNGGSQTCVEVGAIPWRTSSHSNGGSETCVEAGHVPGAVLIRDTKDHGAGPVLRVSPATWSRFTARLRATGGSVSRLAPWPA
jgi:Domain of unknown function (DUF397)